MVSAVSLTVFPRAFHAPAPRERVFEALTTHRGLKRWWTDTCEVNPGVGGESRFHFDRGYYVIRVDEITRAARAVAEDPARAREASLELPAGARQQSFLVQKSAR